MDEVEFKQNFRLSRAAGHFPPKVRNSAVKVWGMIQLSTHGNCSRFLHAAHNFWVHLYKHFHV